MVSDGTTQGHPVVRLRPVPPVDPPYADDPSLAFWVATDSRQLPLDLTGPRRPRGRTDGRSATVRPGEPPRPPVPPTTGSRTGTDTNGNGRAGASPEAGRAAQRFLTTYLEIVNGYRPPTQLRPLTNPGQTGAILGQLGTAVRQLGPVPRRAARPQVRLRTLRVCEPRPGVAEAAAALALPSGRTSAVAFRLERLRGSWVATVLQVL